jgi:ATP-binding cassette, subfamily B, bacterial
MPPHGGEPIMISLNGDGGNRNRPDGKVPKDTPPRRRRYSKEDGFQIGMVFSAFTSLPRVLKLVWSTQPFYTLVLGALTVIRGFLPAASAWITKLVIDSVVAALPPRNESVSTVMWLVLLQLVISVGASLMGSLSNITQQLLQEQVSNRVRLMVMEKANTLDLSFFENPEFYDKLRQAQEQATYRPVGMVSQTFELARTIITFFSMVFLLVQLEWWIAIICLFVPIPQFIADTRFGWWGYQRMRRQSPERRQMSYFENVMTTDTYNKEVKLFNLGDFFVSRFRTLSVKFYKENRSLVIRRYLANFFWGSISLAANAAIYLYVALQAVAGRITLGDLTLFTQAATQVSSSFQGILSGISSTYENNLFVSTLFDFLEYEPKITSPANAQTVVADESGKRGLSIEFRNVSFTYPGKREAALKNVSFQIAAGEAIALVGRNGAGKTTIVKLLNRLYDPDEGQILVGGRDIKEYDLADLRAQVGVIFQDYVTYFMSAQSNIGVGQLNKIEDLELIKASAAKSGADSVIGKLPSGYDTMLGRWFNEGTQLSGGEWQKIALARAFMRDARILVLDEPTSSLDARAEYEVFVKFRELMEGKTAIFISHRFSTVRLADRIFVIEDGQLQEQGSHAELIELDGRYAELFNLQANAYR